MNIKSHKRIAPGTRGHLLLGSLPDMQRKHLELFMKVTHQHGDVVRLGMGPKILHLIVHPDHVQHVLMEHQSNYPKTKLNDKVKGFLGEGLLASQGDLLSMLMLARDEETGEAMSDRQIRDEIMTMFLAGYDSPSINCRSSRL